MINHAARSVRAGLAAIALMALSSGAVTMRIYHIGNSLTDEVKYDAFMGLAESRGHTHIWARQMIPGAPLGWNWNHPGGFVKQPYGDYYNALTNYDWDALVLQPFQWNAPTESDYAVRFANLARRRYDKTMNYIHMTWPANNVSQYGDFETQWLDDWTATNRSRDYFVYVADSIAAIQGADAVRIIPNGEVMYEMWKDIQAGTFTLLPDIWSIYADGIHLNDTGSYLVATCHYAVIYQDDPVGLPTTGFDVPQNLADAIQQYVHDVVLAYDRTGVTGFGPYPVTGVSLMPEALELTVGQSADLSYTIAPTNATNQAVSWGTNAGGVATVTDGVVTAESAGTATITVTTDDGSHTDQCVVTVVASGTPVSGVTITPDTTSVLTGNTVTLAADVSPAGATNTDVVWSSLDGSVATVDAAGEVTGVSKGRALVVATSVNGALRDTALVSVTIVNTSPVPVMIARPVIGYQNATFKFDGTQSYDTDSGDFVLGYDWDFGDGSPVNFSMNPWHEYADTGHFTVRFRAMDYNDTRSDWIQTQLVVKQRYDGILIYEGFEYPVDSAMKGMQSGYGWHVSSWSSNKGIVADTDQPAFGGLATFGNYMYGGDGYRGPDLRSDGTIVPLVSGGRLGGAADSTMWVSFLVRKENDNDQAAYFRAHSSKFDCCDNGYVRAGYLGTASNDGGTRYWSVALDDAVTRTTVPVVAGETALLVARLHWTATSTDVDLYVNPSSLAGAVPAQPDAQATVASVFQFQALALRSGGTNEVSFDELRVGTSFAAVTPTDAVGARACGSLPRRAPTACRIMTRRHALVLTGLPLESDVRIFDAAGRTVRAVRQGGASMVTPLPTGSYVVQVLRHGRTIARQSVVVP